MAVNDGRVMSNFVIQALRSQPLTIYGDGGQTRSFCYVSDMVRGMFLLMELEEFLGPVNLGNPQETSMLELAHRVIEMTGSRAGIEYRPLPPDDPGRRRPDISLAKTRLEWAPEVPFEKGLGLTIEYFREKLATVEG
jgi:UDP-glucuronate decarboxylase